jgi:predicted nucleotidyltransferase
MIQDYRFIKELERFPCIIEIALFGSRARGDNHPKSDIDLVITCPTATKDDWMNILDVIDNADTLLKIDCIRFDHLKIKDQLYQNILLYKKILYKKKT